MTACALCSAAAARSPSAPFDVRENARQVCGRFGVVSLHPEGMRHLGEAPGQAAKRAGLRATRQPLEGRRCRKGRDATLGGVQEVVVMVAMVGRRPGGRNGH